ncbi:MAG: phage terminase small subunit P27 family, partial [Methyloligellaceae bacterium]
GAHFFETSQHYVCRYREQGTNMIRGTKPKPTRLRKAEGTLHYVRKRPNEPKPEGGKLTIPSHLTVGAKQEWRRLVKAMEHCEIFTQVDRQALAIYCEAYDRWVEALKVVRKTGYVVKDKKTNRAIINPYLRVANQAVDVMRQFGPELGFTPASRTRIEAKGTAKDAAKLDEFVGKLKVKRG